MDWLCGSSAIRSAIQDARSVAKAAGREARMSAGEFGELVLDLLDRHAFVDAAEADRRRTRALGDAREREWSALNPGQTLRLKAIRGVSPQGSWRAEASRPAKSAGPTHRA